MPLASRMKSHVHRDVVTEMSEARERPVVGFVLPPNSSDVRSELPAPEKQIRTDVLARRTGSDRRTDYLALLCVSLRHDSAGVELGDRRSGRRRRLLEHRGFAAETESSVRPELARPLEP